MPHRDLVYRFRVRLDPETGVASVEDARGARDRIVMGEPVRRCIEGSIQAARVDKARLALALPIVAFAQKRLAFEPQSGLHTTLAFQASILGWLAYERGEYEEALAYFEDAYWIFHRAEYQLLIAMALDASGKRGAAVRAYRHFARARPDAPETPAVASRIAQLRAGTVSRPRQAQPRR